MKNKIYKVAGYCMLTAAMLSCNNRLEEYNPSGATAEAAWTTPQGFLTNVNGAYQEQRAYYGKEDGALLAESGTDLWFTANKSTYAGQITRYTSLNGSNPGNPTTSIFRLFYRAINICNAGINRIDNAGFPNVDEKNRRLAELRFLRAFYYWHIVEQFGGIVLRTTETTDLQLTASRSSVSAFYDLILSDLKFAADNLPIDWGQEYSRASKKSALGMLARAYLSRAYYAPAGSAERTEYLTMARNTANDVITRASELNTALATSPADLWNPANNKTDVVRKEALYIISNSTTVNLNYDGNGNRLHGWYLTTYSGRPGLIRSIQYGFDNEKRLQPTLHLLDLFNEQMDGRYAASFQETWNANTSYTWTTASAASFGKSTTIAGTQLVPNTSLALQITKQVVPDKATKPWVIYDRNDLYNTSDGTIKSLTDFVPMKKFLDYTRTSPDTRAGFNDIMVIRLAEMYLISAEAEVGLNNFAAAADKLNVLRVRAAIKTPVNYSEAMKLTAAQVGDATTGRLNLILDERARELCGEHLRWYDLKRILNEDNFASYIKNRNRDITTVENYHRLRPVPLTELNALQNGAEFGQNPGYSN
ncbi:RagB/SusD family nutrient uptake outer membrane protein [Mucilaginibacter aquatilis]|nr:RagB/SusD family nutrient uptake outer membrane protein [Mucilaginibacter aquatilis]